MKHKGNIGRRTTRGCRGVVGTSEAVLFSGERRLIHWIDHVYLMGVQTLISRQLFWEERNRKLVFKFHVVVKGQEKPHLCHLLSSLCCSKVCHWSNPLSVEQKNLTLLEAGVLVVWEWSVWPGAIVFSVPVPSKVVLKVWQWKLKVPSRLVARAWDWLQSTWLLKGAIPSSFIVPESQLHNWLKLCTA